MEFTETDRQYMGLALAEAEKAFSTGEVAVGCAIVKDGAVLVCAHNKVKETGDLTAHAECLAIRSLSRYALAGATLYVTLEPCPMCAGAIALSGITRVIYGAGDPAYGCCGSVYRLTEDPAFPNFAKADGGCRAEECGKLLSQSMKNARAKDKKEQA